MQTTQTQKIVFLADYPDFIPQVGEWIWHEWGRKNSRTKQECINDLAENGCFRDRYDVTLIALEHNGECIGCMQLMEDDDLEGFRHLKPWAGSFYVEPAYRQGKTAFALWNAMIDLCDEMKIPDFYAHTAILQKFLLRRKAVKIGCGFYSKKPVDVFHVRTEAQFSSKKAEC